MSGLGFFAPSTFARKDNPIGPQGPGQPHCGACGLFKQCKSPRMKPTGDGRLKILFLGEAPGETEDEMGKQFVGEAGRTLRDLLEDVGVDLEDCRVTNSAICRPPDNKIEDLHIDSCRPSLYNTLREFKPNVVVPLGLSAVKSIIGPEWGGDVGAMQRWVGWQIPSARYGCWVCPTYHPSFLNRTGNDPVLMRAVRGHLRAAMALEGVPPRPADLDALKRNVECITNPRLGRLRLKDLARKQGVLAFDYETTGKKPEPPDQKIISAAFCLDGADTFALLYHESQADTLRAVLLNPGLLKVASNLKFEERWSIQKLGVRVAGWHWDTMLGAHYHDNRRYITGVKFQAYIHLGIGSYAEWVEDYFDSDSGSANAINRIKDLHHTDLLIYNGLDAVIEYLVFRRQQDLLGWGRLI